MRISDWSSYVCSSDLSRIGPGHVFDPAGTEQWDDMAFDPSEVGVDGRRPFRPPALAENEPRFEIGPVKVAQLFDGQRLVTELLFFCRIVTARNPAKLRFCFEPGRLRAIGIASSRDRVCQYG